MHRKTLAGLATFALILGIATGCGDTAETPKPTPTVAPTEPKPAATPAPAAGDAWCCVYDGENGKVHALTSAKECTEKYADHNPEYVKKDECAEVCCTVGTDHLRLTTAACTLRKGTGDKDLAACPVAVDTKSTAPATKPTGAASSKGKSPKGKAAPSGAKGKAAPSGAKGKAAPSGAKGKAAPSGAKGKTAPSGAKGKH